MLDTGCQDAAEGHLVEHDGSVATEGDLGAPGVEARHPLTENSRI